MKGGPQNDMWDGKVNAVVTLTDPLCTMEH